ncbi:MAG TPA: hypothetical protein PK926_16905 [Spirochaetota bacterium]|nr:hypothetical protein [Spirochaetota bacterium]HPI89493.1 hypothetical protein [Spirochaetota bacterium]HPR49566.1 hypothetical protein [Spirochaetota bacterium]
MDERRNRFSSIVLLCVLSGIYLFVFSEGGVLERINLQRKNDGLLSGIRSLNEEKKRLESTLRDYEKGGKTGEDVLSAGFIRSGDQVVFLRNAVPGTGTAAKEKKDEASFTFEMIHYRILWVVLSLLIFFFHYSRRPHKEDGFRNA